MLRFNEVPQYRKFIDGRNAALDHFFRNHRLRLTDIQNAAFMHVLAIIKYRYGSIKNAPHDTSKLRALEYDLEHLFNDAVHKIVQEQKRLRKISFLISYGASAQAIAKIVAKSVKGRVDAHALDRVAMGPAQDNLTLYHRLRVPFAKLRRRIMDAVEKAVLNGDEDGAAMGRVYLALPKRIGLPKSPVLKKMREARRHYPGAGEQVSGTSIGVTGSAATSLDYDKYTWDQALEEYKTEYTPIDRSPIDGVDGVVNPFTGEPFPEDASYKDKVYSWEIEKEASHDFVMRVRAGENEAAKANGVDEFVWVSIIDDHTCDKCCLWRNGLLTSEIEERLAKEPELADYCDAIMPPAHFNCRCAPAPASKDMEVVENTDINMEFDQWLNG
jgi:hypothetical protein